tara:strand:- start:5576 stop:6607 length:1032 start_codon:yes stop_codon:yes gene_type:complete
MTAFDDWLGDLTEKLRELVPEGYASIHPNEYWEKDKGNPMPYPRPLGLLEHSELEDYWKFLEGFESAESGLKHNPNLSEEDYLHHALEVTNNPAKDWNEDMRLALLNERGYRKQEQHVDAQRRGNIFGGGWLPEGLANPERGVLYSQPFQDLNRSLDDSFEEAWDLVKMPLWYESGTTADYSPEDYTDDERGLTHTPGSVHQRFSLVPRIETETQHLQPLGASFPRYWESKDKDARGYATFREGDAPDDPIDPYHQISMFEIAEDIRGTGKARNRLQELIAELREHDPEARSIHVTHSENDTAALWDKFVDEGLIDSASTKPWVTTTPEGRLIRHTKYREDDL